MKRKSLLASAMVFICGALVCSGAVYNLKIVTDASPDYSDTESMIHSITSHWNTPEEKCWAMFYWNHIGRRQTSPMMLHGMALTDPIRQFNDYGYTMCSTISGINCSIWDAMGLKAKYWDISNHTVAEVEYGGAWHMYDNSLSALYTLCDGKTLAGVEDIGKTGACAASGGKAEPGHIARYHCRTSTSANGFLSGADTIRSLDEEYRCFNPNGLKYRSYFYDWDRGHRYILNLRRNESYTRYYHSLGKTAEFYVPNGGKDPEAANTRYHLRGNGIRAFKPLVDPEGWRATAHSHSNLTVSKERGLAPIKAGQRGEIVFKIEGANVITALEIKGRVFRKTSADVVSIDVSTSNGLSWTNVWKSNQSGEQEIDLKLIEAVNGSYEVLLQVALMAQAAPADISLRELDCRTITMLNSKTQPRLQLGKNTIEVGAGDQSESIVVWPDLQKDQYQRLIVDEQNMTSAKRHPGYMGAMHAVKAREPAFVVFKIDAPRDISRAVYGGRLYNRAPRSKISFLHSFDLGKTRELSYALTNTAQPWDVIHYETLTNIPPHTASIFFKYLLE